MSSELSEQASRLEAERNETTTWVSYADWLPKSLPLKWQVARHMVTMAEYLDKVRSGSCKRLRITMPPRHGKTETCTIRFAVRWLLDHPDHNILVTGYNQRYANRLSRKIRQEARRMGVRIKRGASSVSEWETEAGGTVVARGVGSPPTGIGFNLIIIDDPVRDHRQAESSVQREMINDWYLTDILQRQQPGCAIVLVMTQWHHWDLATVAVEAEKEVNPWTELVLRSLAENDDILGRSIGEALWPDMFSASYLTGTRDAMASRNGPRMFDALFQCRPYPKDGNQLKRTDFIIIDADQVPVGLKEYRAYDCALSGKQQADKTVGTRGGMDERGDLYLTDQVAIQADIADTFNEILSIGRQDGPDIPIGIERPLAGTVYIQMLDKDARAANLRVIRVEVRGRDKTVRMGPWAIKARNRKLFLVRGAWNEPFIKQALEFTGDPGNEDDRVDSVSVLTEVIALGSGERHEKTSQPKEGSLEYWLKLTGDDVDESE